MSMSRHSRAMLLNVLWHHQGESSRVGQPIRSIIGLGRNERMTDEQVDEAKWIDRLLAAGPDVASEVAKLRAEVLRLRMCAPGGRAPHRISMAPHVGPTNAEFYGIKLDTDEEFAAWGRPVPNESEA